MCSIVPLSTQEPRIKLPCHILLELDPPLPPPYDEPRMWVKGDLVLTVAFHRLRFLSRKKGGKRIYDVRRLPPAMFDRVREGVRFALGLSP